MSLNIIGTFDYCMSQEPKLVWCIQVMKFKWLYYLSDCLKTYYKCLTISFDILALVRDVMQLLYSLYDEYAKFYGPFLTQALIIWIGKGY